ncbi:NAD-dependent epimerase/dehydratase family protein [Geminocystis sp. GBBB08]|uniref:NAD-dependent epimerase/dehydratase family protein n=1 Tax=Geminocystis sp. GBBB08 TaxID=2604140 RepID=UPI0027E34BFD|nr:NAD-dependent epimerase/dehydratase family protein [Geminocystis sp. GBBB08]MBL1209502.1 NAD-dependent epimerase/dehydratase family protein [Geminocystis sp. GBBB08]
MTSILITGATGFIGSNLLPKLEQNNFNISLTVRNATNFSSIYSLIPLNSIDGDTNWRQALKNIDVVIHMAARAHILKESVTNPEAEFDQVNAEGTINLVKQSIEAGVKHFIFFSSIGAIATLSDTIINESSPCNPDTPYGKSKLKAEKAIKEICPNSTMTYTILRPTLVYGPNNPGNMERLLKLTAKNLPLPLGGINNSRSLVYVGNLVDAIITCIEHPNAKNQIFIISDGEDLSTPELICRIGKAMGKSPLLLPFPPSLLKLATKIIGKEDVGDRLLGSLQVDSSKIRQMLNWNPPYTVDEGLKITVNWFKNAQS